MGPGYGVVEIMVIQRVGGGGAVWSGIMTGGGRSKRRNEHFEFQISFPSIFPSLRLEFDSKPIIRDYEMRTIKVRFISPKGTARQWFGGVSAKKMMFWDGQGPFHTRNDLKH